MSVNRCGRLRLAATYLDVQDSTGNTIIKLALNFKRVYMSKCALNTKVVSEIFAIV